MPTHAPPEPFDPDSEEWEAFMMRFRSYLVANDLERASDDKKRALLIGYCGKRTVRLAQGLVSPQSVETMSWTELQKVLKEHFDPPPSRTVLRHQFNERNQKEGESINGYIAELKMAAEKCNFNDLEERLTDRLVCGVSDPWLQQKLLSKPELSWKMAVDIARAAECAKKSSASIKHSSKSLLHEKPAKMEKAGNVHQVSEESESDLSGEETIHLQQQKPRKRWNESLCSGCGGKHSRSNCKFKEVICRRCEKKGHLARVCCASMPSALSDKPFPESKRAERNQTKKKTNHIRICLNKKEGAKKIKIDLQIQNKPCQMEVDTGSALTILPWRKLKEIMPGLQKDQLKRQHSIISDYQGRRIAVLGRQTVQVEFKSFKGQLDLTVVEKNLPSLLGLEWFRALGLHVEGINKINASVPDNDFAALMSDFPDLFAEGLGKYKGKPISFNLDPQVAPIRLKPRRVPFALREKVDEQIDKLIKQGILEPVEHANWETPIVTPTKSDGSLRICGDYKSTLNKAMHQSAYPVPVVQHLLHQLGNGKVFAKLDLAQAYQQLPVCPKTAEAQTIVTHRGAFRCTRLQFGVSVAPGLFQSLMERLLVGLPGVVPYFDDILISASSLEELQKRVRKVFEKLQDVGLRLKKDKCQFGKKQVEFLGYLIDSQGIHPTKEKTEAIWNAPAPRSQSELQAFLGLLNFYSAFLPHKASVAEPLHRLLEKKAVWKWGPSEQTAFKAVKKLLLSNQVLIQYNAVLPVTLACDASPYGVGAVLSHVLPNGEEAPIAFYSRTLSSAERNYSQIDKEGLALVAGVKKFHEYLYGRHFTLVTDHKPLLGILAGDKPTPTILSPRFTRWAVFLAAYNYVLRHRPGKTIAHADALSRCPLPNPVSDPAPVNKVFSIDLLAPGLLTANMIARATSKDSQLAQVACWVGRGWPAVLPKEEWRPFWTRRNELSLLKGCILWGDRVIIPTVLREKVLTLLHEGHPGMVKMKALARSYAWWPKMEEGIERWVATCPPCQESRPNPPRAPCKEWEKPRGPWSRIHIDFAGPMQGHSFLIVVDAFSKWLEVIKMTSTTAEATSRALRKIFATHGLPDIIVSDNGPQFTNLDFEVFLAESGIRHVLVAPHHAASNGEAEIFVKLTKAALKKMEDKGWQHRIDDFLLMQHITPNTSTGKSPAELLMGRRLRSKLDRIHPDYIEEHLSEETGRQRKLGVGDKVFARNFGEGPTWMPGEITAVTGPRSYRLQVPDGQIWRRHQDHLRSRVEQPKRVDQETQEPLEFQTEESQDLSGEVGESNEDSSALGPTALRADLPDVSEAGPAPAADPPLQVAAEEKNELRRSTRTRQRPGYLRDYVTN